VLDASALRWDFLVQPALQASVCAASTSRPDLTDRDPHHTTPPATTCFWPPVMPLLAGDAISRASSPPACCPHSRELSCLVSSLLLWAQAMASGAIGAWCRPQWAERCAGAQAQPGAVISPGTH